MAGRVKAVRLDDGSTAWLRYDEIGQPAPPPPPPPLGATIFGYNNSDPTRLTKMNRWKRVPCGRGYYGTAALPAAGAGFASGGKEFKLAGLDQAAAGVVSSKRVNVSSKFTLGSITSSTSAKVVETKKYALSVPHGWTVYIGWHEYNRKRSAAELLQFISSFQFLGEACWEANEANIAAGRGEVVYIINAAGSGLDNVTFDDSSAPAADTMPPNTLFIADAYGNPQGTGGLKAYGTPYPPIGDVFNDVYDIAEALGYLDNSDGGSRGWGIGETGSPRRVAPKITPLDAGLGWGPGSPHDIDGTGQAQFITDACEYALGNFDPSRPIPAKLFLNWVQPAGSNWNQDYSTAGSTDHDDGTAASPGPHYQGFPIPVDPTKPYAAYKHYVDISA